MISLSTVFYWVSVLIGTFGVGGAACFIAGMVFLGPSAMMAIVQPILTKYLECTKCLVATVFVLAAVGAFWVGHHEARKECKEDELASQLAAQQADTKIAKKAQADAVAKANSIEAKANAQHKKDLSYINSLQGKGGCALDGTPLDAGGVRKPRIQFFHKKPAAVSE